MIDNPDGTRRLPTKEEILENVRNKSRSLQSDNNSSQTSIGTDKSTSSEDRRFFSEGRGSSFTFEGRNRLDEGNTGSQYGTNDRIFTEARTARNGDSSVDEYSQRATAYASGEQRTIEQPVRKSRFKPYADAIKQSLKKNNSTVAKKEPVSKKVLTKQESDAYREKLIEMLLWQSDHADELIKATTKGHSPVNIWSDLDKEDARKIANYMLERAKTDKQMAYIVREMVSLKDRIELAIIILPRVYRTMTTYLERGFSIR